MFFRGRKDSLQLSIIIEIITPQNKKQKDKVE